MGSFLVHLPVSWEISCSSDCCSWVTAPLEGIKDLRTSQLQVDGLVFSRASVLYGEKRKAKAYLEHNNTGNYLSEAQATST